MSAIVNRFDPAISRRPWVKHGERLSVLDFGAVADGVILFDGAINASSTTLTSALMAGISGSRVPTVGRSIWIEGAGVAGADLLTTIAAVNSPSSIELTAAAATSVSNKEFRFGTDSTVGIQLAFSAAAERGVEIQFPRGSYLITAPLAVYDNLAITGQSYCHLPFLTDALSSNLIGLGDFPLIDFPSVSYVNPLISFNARRLAFRGTSRTGSKGIHLGNIFGIILRDLSFDYFGDQALHIELGIDGTFENLFGVNTLLVRSRASKAGGFQIGCSDAKIDQVACTTSVSFPPGSVIGGEYGDGNGAGLMITGGNSFVSDSFGHGSQIGWYIGQDTANLTTFVNCRADLNQGPGFVIDAGYGEFVGCRSHANSLDTNGAYSGFLILKGGNAFRHCRVTTNGVGIGPIFNQTKHGFELKVPDSQEACYFSDNYSQFGCLTGELYYNTPGAYQQFSTIRDSTGQDPLGHMVHRQFGETHIRGTDNQSGLFFRNDSATDVGADERLWAQRAYQNQFFLLEVWDDAQTTRVGVITALRSGTGVDFLLIDNVGYTQITSPLILRRTVIIEDPSQATDERRWNARTNGVEFLISASDDLTTTENVAIKIHRTGASIDWIQFLAKAGGYMDMQADVILASGKLLQFATTTAKVLAGIGSPEGIVGAVGGSLFLDGNGRVWGKIQGAGDTGWSKLLSLYAPDLTANRVVKVDGSNNLFSDKIDLGSANDITGTLAISHGGTGATTAAAALTALSAYSKSEVDAIVATLYSVIAGKATAGASTGSGGSPVHSHTQT